MQDFDFDLDLDLDLSISLEPDADIPDPMQGVESGSVEAESAAELKALKSAYADPTAFKLKGTLRTEAAKRAAITDTEYFVCLVFQSRAEADAFLLATDGATNDKYIDGRPVAKRLGIELPKAEPIKLPRGKIDQKWAELAL